MVHDKERIQVKINKGKGTQAKSRRNQPEVSHSSLPVELQRWYFILLIAMCDMYKVLLIREACPSLGVHNNVGMENPYDFNYSLQPHPHSKVKMICHGSEYQANTNRHLP